jgi:effector-binding domain-containing protein
MGTSFSLECREPLLTCYIRAVVPSQRITQSIMGRLVLILDAIDCSLVDPIGPVYSRKHLASEAETDLEVGIVISSRFHPPRGIKCGVLPGGRFAVGRHLGNASGIPTARRELMAWLEDQNLRPIDSGWSTYLTDPASELDPSRWRTELLMPLEILR